VSRNSKFIVVVAGALGIAAVAAAVAYAAWSGTGTGSGRARATTAVAVTITPSNGTADLYPGFTGGDVSFTLNNTNPYSITFTSMTAGAVTVDAGHPSCPAGSVTVAPATGLSLVSAPGTSGPLSIADVVSMSSTAPDGCQGASFDVVLTLTGTQT
jgi:hypothetical protein